MEIGLLRSALYRAARDRGPEGLSHDELTGRVFDALGVSLERFASNPSARFKQLSDTKAALRDVLGYRLYRDLERGWRVTSPNLEQRWIAFIKGHGYRLPSHAQRLFEEAGTRPDFFYDGDYGAAIYVDGPHHDYPERRVRDAAQEEAMEDLGYVVIRFGHQGDWAATVAEYPYVFGDEG